jgi:hypothetical protein
VKAFTYSEARQSLAKLLNLAEQEEVEIRRKDGTVFTLRAKPSAPGSPLDVPGIETAATTADILDACPGVKRALKSMAEREGFEPSMEL